MNALTKIELGEIEVSSSECDECSEEFGTMQVNLAKYKQVLEENKSLVLQIQNILENTVPNFETEIDELKAVIENRDAEIERLRASTTQRKIRELEITVEDLEE
eukprot:UN25653